MAVSIRAGLAILLGMLVVGCNGNGLHPVDDTGDIDDTGEETPDLLGILVTPERVAIPLGGEVQLTATGLLEDRSSLDVTAVVVWGSLNPSIAQVSDGLDEEGIIRGLAAGKTEVYAETQGIRSVSVKVTVTAATLLGLTIHPAEVTAEQGQSVQLQAEAAFSDGSRADASAQVLWGTGNPSVATMESGGKLNAVAAGTTNIHAEWNGTESALVPVTVLQSAQPDLRVLSVLAETGPTDVTLTITLVNGGTGSASDFWVDVFVDPPSAPEPGALGDYYQPVFYAGPGEELEAAVNFEVSEGDHTIYVVLDTDDEVEESNESNTTYSPVVTVGGRIGDPNLTINSFDYYADEDTILYAIDVYNGGSKDVDDFYVDLWVHAEDDPTASGIGDEFLLVDGLEAGATEYVDFLIDVVDLPEAYEGCEYCWSWAMVDTNAYVEETDEDDNVAGPIEVEVPQP
ncbi:MAG: Ig-like domain-containing protein [Deltaproteobacteria bacterium]|nr:Ig-like domain-containing protein [Deltaproteobacteria bacterium]